MYEPSPEERAILRTVVYASVFDYPLTLAQLQRHLVGSRQTEAEILSCFRASVWLQDAIDHRDGFFFPTGRHDLVAERRRREAATRAFLDQHARLLRLLCAVPFTRLVALSGSVAHLNMDGHGDLDLFVITRGRRVWSVAVTMLLVAKVARQRQITCVNYLLSDRALPLDQQDLFTANQIVSLRPMIGAKTFQAFVAQNPFVSSFYPNFCAAGASPTLEQPRRLKRLCELALACGPAQAYEWVCRFGYGWYLRKRAGQWSSPDQVRLDRDCLKLHTHSHRRRVTDRFEAALAEVESHRSRVLAVGRTASPRTPRRRSAWRVPRSHSS